jgi:hypothetical protein
MGRIADPHPILLPIQLRSRFPRRPRLAVARSVGRNLPRMARTRWSIHSRPHSGAQHACHETLRPHAAIQLPLNALSCADRSIWLLDNKSARDQVSGRILPLSIRGSVLRLYGNRNHKQGRQTANNELPDERNLTSIGVFCHRANNSSDSTDSCRFGGRPVSLLCAAC